MKQVLEYYYSIVINEIKNIDDYYEFIYNNEKYIFIYTYKSIKDIENLYLCQNELLSKGIKVHKIIINVFNEIITKIDDANYILLKLENSEKLNVEDIIDFQNKTILSLEKRKNYQNDWAKLWASKIDYLESQQNMLLNNNIVHLSLDYFIGLTENGISYLNFIDKNYDNLVLSHKRVKYPCNTNDFYNPLNFIFDVEVRDIAEYIKSEFFISYDDAILDLREYLQIKKISLNNAKLLFARLLYPSFYFDAYDDVINKKKDTSILLKIIDIIPKYEMFLQDCYYEITLYYPIEKINWLIQEH